MKYKNKIILAVTTAVFGILIFATALWTGNNGCGEESNVICTSNGKFEVEILENHARMLSQDGKTESIYMPGEEKKIFDYCISSITNTLDDKLLIITGDSDEYYGNELQVIGISPDGEICKELTKSMKDMNPHDINTSDVDGDGIFEISITMYKKTRFHPVMAERPYIYYWSEDSINPMWRGSRLSRPFSEYLFYDLDGDKREELIAIEYLENGSQLLNAYSWKGFGFESTAYSTAYDEITGLKKRVDKSGASRLLAQIDVDGKAEWIEVEHGEEGVLKLHGEK
ncbi:hypothetical protein [Peptoclostridium litorale]|uniref:hypothetical protein n=1 Tax=Peptoclostridium litorale TaxID=1557 RepID=UPI000695BB81|nr:hypothetical protein [Peptoclostridium litorale]